MTIMQTAVHIYLAIIVASVIWFVEALCADIRAKRS
jgi:hypothetical protein